MASDTQIANRALFHMGVSKTIAVLQTEHSIEAESIKAVFDDDRDYCLRDFHWPFARAYVALGLVGDADVAYNYDYLYAYRYPANCLDIRRIVTAGGRTETDPPPFIIARDDVGKLVLTDESEVTVEFTYAVTDPQEFDPLFNEMLAWKISRSVGNSLSRKEDIVKLAVEMYELEKSKAQSRALQEMQPEKPSDAEWITGR